MTGSIIYDFITAENQAKKLDEVAAQLKTLTQGKMDETKQMLHANWQGESADAFMQKYAAAQEELRRTARDLETIASSIRHRSRVLKAAEEAAKIAAGTNH